MFPIFLWLSSVNPLLFMGPIPANSGQNKGNPAQNRLHGGRGAMTFFYHLFICDLYVLTHSSLLSALFHVLMHKKTVTFSAFQAVQPWWRKTGRPLWRKTSSSPASAASRRAPRTAWAAMGNFQVLALTILTWKCIEIRKFYSFFSNSWWFLNIRAQICRLSYNFALKFLTIFGRIHLTIQFLLISSCKHNNFVQFFKATKWNFVNFSFPRQILIWSPASNEAPMSS